MDKRGKFRPFSIWNRLELPKKGNPLSNLHRQNCDGAMKYIESWYISMEIILTIQTWLLRDVHPSLDNPVGCPAMDLDFEAFRQARWERNSYRKH